MFPVHVQAPVELEPDTSPSYVAVWGVTASDLAEQYLQTRPW